MKKIFTLLACLFAAVSTYALQGETLFHWVHDGSTTDSYMEATGGTVLITTTDPNKAWSTESASYNSAVPSDMRGGSKALKSGGNANYLEVTLAEGTFQPGDVIEICGYNPWLVSLSTDAKGEISGSDGVATGSGKADYNVGSVTIPSDVEPTSTIYLRRQKGSGTGIAALKVTRPDQNALTAPTITPGKASFTQSVEVTITAPKGDIFYYIGDGITSDTFVARPYDGPITITSGCVLHAYASAEGSVSEVTSATFTKEREVYLNTRKMWDFTTVSEADLALLANAEEWTYVNETERYDNVAGFSNGKLIASYTELEYAEGLLFTAGSGGKLRIDPVGKRLGLNGKGISFTIPGLAEGTKVALKAKVASTSGTNRYLSATNLSTSTGFGSAFGTDDWVECSGIVAADGNVTITTQEGGINIESIIITPKEEAPASVIIPQGGATYSSYIGEYPIDITGSDLTAYVVSYVDTQKGEVELTEIAESVVPANTPIIVKGITNGVAEVRVAAEAPAIQAHNMLVGSATESMQLEADRYLVISKDDDLFHWAEAGNLRAGKCAVDITLNPESNVPDSGAKTIVVGIESFDEGFATAIRQAAEAQSSADIYTVGGVRVRSAQQKGIYIVNGKKVVK